MSTLLDLTRMNQIPVEYTLDGMRALRNAEQTDQISLADLQRKYAHEAEMDPLRVEEQGLRNTGLGLANQQQEFTLRRLGREDEIGQYTLGAKKEAELQRLLAEAGAEKSKIFEQELFNKIQQTRPGSPEHKTLLGAIRSTRKFLEEQAKHEHSMEVARINQTGLLQREREAIAAGKYAKMNRFGLSFQDELSRANTAIKVQAVLTRYLSMAQHDPELEPLIPMLNTMLARNEAPYKTETDALRRGGVGNIDAGAVTNLPTRPAQPVQAPPVPVPGQTPAPPAPSKPAPVPPKPGEIRNGWRFKGGNPGDKANWEKV